MPDLVLIVHSKDASVGTTSEWCRLNDVSYEIFNAEDFPHRAPPETSAVIIFGGDMEAWEIQERPWLIVEKQFIRSNMTLQHKLFGICLGAQLLAEQLGQAPQPATKWELGWYPVELVGETETSLTPLHWHSSQFALPPDCRLLASNADTYCQGFSRSSTIIGYQFHTEMNDERLAKAVESFNGSAIGRVQNIQTIESLAPRYMPELKSWYFNQLSTWWKAK